MMVKNGKVSFETEEIKEAGKICGVNIKPIKVKKNKKLKLGLSTRRSDVTTWGVFIHFRMANGDQYDLIFPIGKTFKTNSRSLDNYLPMKCEDYNWSVPEILRLCGVNEWVELIGTQMYIYKFTQDGEVKALRLKAVNWSRSYSPKYFEIIKNKFEKTIFT